MRFDKIILLMFMIIIISQSCEKNVEEDHIDITVDCTQVESYFTDTVLPIMEANCTACHFGTAPSGNLALTEYTAVKNAMGSILDRVNREEGTSGFMPMDSSKLSDSDLSILQSFFDMECDE